MLTRDLFAVTDLVLLFFHIVLLRIFVHLHLNLLLYLGAFYRNFFNNNNNAKRVSYCYVRLSVCLSVRLPNASTASNQGVHGTTMRSNW